MADELGRPTRRSLFTELLSQQPAGPPAQYGRSPRTVSSGVATFNGMDHPPRPGASAYTAPLPAAQLLERFGIPPAAIRNTTHGIPEPTKPDSPPGSTRTLVAPPEGKETRWTSNGPNATHVPYARGQLNPIFADLVAGHPARPARSAGSAAAAPVWRPGGGGGAAKGTAAGAGASQVGNSYVSRAAAAAAARARATSRQTSTATRTAAFTSPAYALPASITDSRAAVAAASRPARAAPVKAPPVPRSGVAALRSGAAAAASTGPSSASVAPAAAAPRPAAPRGPASRAAVGATPSPPHLGSERTLHGKQEGARPLSYAEWEDAQHRGPSALQPAWRSPNDRRAAPQQAPLGPASRVITTAVAAEGSAARVTAASGSTPRTPPPLPPGAAKPRSGGGGGGGDGGGRGGGGGSAASPAGSGQAALAGARRLVAAAAGGLAPLIESSGASPRTSDESSSGGANPYSLPSAESSGANLQSFPSITTLATGRLRPPPPRPPGLGSPAAGGNGRMGSPMAVGGTGAGGGRRAGAQKDLVEGLQGGAWMLALPSDGPGRLASPVLPRSWGGGGGAQPKPHHQPDEQQRHIASAASHPAQAVTPGAVGAGGQAATPHVHYQQQHIGAGTGGEGCGDGGARRFDRLSSETASESADGCDQASIFMDDVVRQASVTGAGLRFSNAGTTLRGGCRKSNSFTSGSSQQAKRSAAARRPAAVSQALRPPAGGGPISEPGEIRGTGNTAGSSETRAKPSRDVEVIQSPTYSRRQFETEEAPPDTVVQRNPSREMWERELGVHERCAARDSGAAGGPQGGSRAGSMYMLTFSQLEGLDVGPTMPGAPNGTSPKQAQPVLTPVRSFRLGIATEWLSDDDDGDEAPSPTLLRAGGAAPGWPQQVLPTQMAVSQPRSMADPDGAGAGTGAASSPAGDPQRLEAHPLTKPPLPPGRHLSPSTSRSRGLGMDMGMGVDTRGGGHKPALSVALPGDGLRASYQLSPTHGPPGRQSLLRQSRSAPRGSAGISGGLVGPNQPGSLSALAWDMRETMRAASAGVRRNSAAQMPGVSHGATSYSPVSVRSGSGAEGPGGPRGSISGMSNFSALSGPQADVLYNYPSHGYMERAAEYGLWEASMMYDLDLYNSMQLNGFPTADEYDDPAYLAQSQSGAAALLLAGAQGLSPRAKPASPGGSSATAGLIRALEIRSRGREPPRRTSSASAAMLAGAVAAAGGGGAELLARGGGAARGRLSPLPRSLSRASHSLSPLRASTPVVGVAVAGRDAQAGPPMSPRGRVTGESMLDLLDQILEDTPAGWSGGISDAQTEQLDSAASSSGAGNTTGTGHHASAAELAAAMAARESCMTGTWSMPCSQRASDASTAKAHPAEGPPGGPPAHRPQLSDKPTPLSGPLRSASPPLLPQTLSGGGGLGSAWEAAAAAAKNAWVLPHPHSGQPGAGGLPSSGYGPHATPASPPAPQHSPRPQLHSPTPVPHGLHQLSSGSSAPRTTAVNPLDPSSAGGEQLHIFAQAPLYASQSYATVLPMHTPYVRGARAAAGWPSPHVPPTIHEEILSHPLSGSAMLSPSSSTAGSAGAGTQQPQPVQEEQLPQTQLQPHLQNATSNIAEPEAAAPGGGGGELPQPARAGIPSQFAAHASALPPHTGAAPLVAPGTVTAAVAAWGAANPGAMPATADPSPLLAPRGSTATSACSSTSRDQVAAPTAPGTLGAPGVRHDPAAAAASGVAAEASAGGDQSAVQSTVQQAVTSPLPPPQPLQRHQQQLDHPAVPQRPPSRGHDSASPAYAAHSMHEQQAGSVHGGGEHKPAHLRHVPVWRQQQQLPYGCPPQEARSYSPPSLEAIQRLLESDLPTSAIAAAVAVLAGSLPQTWARQESVRYCEHRARQTLQLGPERAVVGGAVPPGAPGAAAAFVASQTLPAPVATSGMPGQVVADGVAGPDGCMQGLSRSGSVSRSYMALLTLAGERGMPPKALQEEGELGAGEIATDDIAHSDSDKRVQVALVARSDMAPADGPLGRAVRLIAQSILIVLAGAAGATAAASTANAVFMRPEDLPFEHGTSIYYSKRPRPKRLFKPLHR